MKDGSTIEEFIEYAEGGGLMKAVYFYRMKIENTPRERFLLRRRYWKSLNYLLFVAEEWFTGRRVPTKALDAFAERHSMFRLDA